MTLLEKIIATAYTGINFCYGRDEWNEFKKYIERVMGHPVQTIEMASGDFWDTLHDLTESDFHRMLKGCYSGRTDWTPVTEALPEADGEYLVTVVNDCGTRRRQVSSFTQYNDGTCYTWGIETGPIYTVEAWMPLPEMWEDSNG